MCQEESTEEQDHILEVFSVLVSDYSCLVTSYSRPLMAKAFRYGDKPWHFLSQNSRISWRMRFNGQIANATFKFFSLITLSRRLRSMENLPQWQVCWVISLKLLQVFQSSKCVAWHQPSHHNWFWGSPLYWFLPKILNPVLHVVKISTLSEYNIVKAQDPWRKACPLSIWCNLNVEIQTQKKNFDPSTEDVLLLMYPLSVLILSETFRSSIRLYLKF